MNDILTVIRKELIELLGNRHSYRGALLQATVVVIVCGIMIPSGGKQIWVDVKVTSLLYFLFPSVLAASVAADSFAGERERKTLETLLATPLPDSAIFLGKIATAVMFALGAATASIAAAIATLNLSAHEGGFYFPPAGVVLGLFGGALGASLVTSALAVTISMRVPVARSAQQLSSLLSMGMGAVVSIVVSQLGLELTWNLIHRIDLIMLIVGYAALRSMGRVFQRERLLENR